MNIGLDYDGTFTSDPTMWVRFITDATLRGHSVWIVTMRYPSECDGTKGTIDQRLREMRVPIVCTSRAAKGPHCKKLGIDIHVWVDDNPQAVHQDAMSIWSDSSPEGHIIAPRYGS
jgi:hypothetical protein